MWPIIVLFFGGGESFAPWILFTLNSLPGILKFNIIFLSMLLVKIEITPSSRFTGLNIIYSRYHKITDVYTTALLLTKPSSDDSSGFRHGFGAQASLPLAQNTPNSISRHHQTLLDCCRSVGLPDPRWCS